MRTRAGGEPRPRAARAAGVVCWLAPAVPAGAAGARRLEGWALAADRYSGEGAGTSRYTHTLSLSLDMTHVVTPQPRIHSGSLPYNPCHHTRIPFCGNKDVKRADSPGHNRPDQDVRGGAEAPGGGVPGMQRSAPKIGGRGAVLPGAAWSAVHQCTQGVRCAAGPRHRIGGRGTPGGAYFERRREAAGGGGGSGARAAPGNKCGPAV